MLSITKPQADAGQPVTVPSAAASQTVSGNTFPSPPVNNTSSNGVDASADILRQWAKGLADLRSSGQFNQLGIDKLYGNIGGLKDLDRSRYNGGLYYLAMSDANDAGNGLTNTGNVNYQNEFKLFTSQIDGLNAKGELTPDNVNRLYDQYHFLKSSDMGSGGKVYYSAITQANNYGNGLSNSGDIALNEKNHFLNRIADLKAKGELTPDIVNDLYYVNKSMEKADLANGGKIYSSAISLANNAGNGLSNTGDIKYQNQLNQFLTQINDLDTSGALTPDRVNTIYNGYDSLKFSDMRNGGKVYYNAISRANNSGNGLSNTGISQQEAAQNDYTHQFDGSMTNKARDVVKAELNKPLELQRMGILATHPNLPNSLDRYTLGELDPDTGNPDARLYNLDSSSVLVDTVTREKVINENLNKWERILNLTTKDVQALQVPIKERLTGYQYGQIRPFYTVTDDIDRFDLTPQMIRDQALMSGYMIKQATVGLSDDEQKAYAFIAKDFGDQLTSQSDAYVKKYGHQMPSMSDVESWMAINPEFNNAGVAFTKSFLDTMSFGLLDAQLKHTLPASAYSALSRAVAAHPTAQGWGNLVPMIMSIGGLDGIGVDNEIVGLDMPIAKEIPEARVAGAMEASGADDAFYSGIFDADPMKYSASTPPEAYTRMEGAGDYVNGPGNTGPTTVQATTESAPWVTSESGPGGATYTGSNAPEPTPFSATTEAPAYTTPQVASASPFGEGIGEPDIAVEEEAAGKEGAGGEYKTTDASVGKPNPKVSYKRPSSFRNWMRKKVWNDAKDIDGYVRDPLTGRIISEDEPWQMGHKPGYEFRKHKLSAESRGISRKQFLDEYNNPGHYRPELPESNMSHAAEDKTGRYLGD